MKGPDSGGFAERLLVRLVLVASTKDETLVTAHLSACIRLVVLLLLYIFVGFVDRFHF
jgi:hypothetical protein